MMQQPLIGWRNKAKTAISLGNVPIKYSYKKLILSILAMEKGLKILRFLPANFR